MTHTTTLPLDPTTASRSGRYDSLTGRCIYCDQRCDAQATYHDYCREAQTNLTAEQSPHNERAQR